MDIIDLNNCCRTCGNSTDELIPIFDNERSYELNTKISTYLNLQVLKTDKLPQKICTECTTTLLSFHDLYLCCLKTKERYHSSTPQGEITKNNEHGPETINCSAESYALNLSKEVEDTLSNRHTKGTREQATEMSDCTCQYCSDTFTTKEELINHLRNVHTDLIFLCDVCKEYLPRNNLLEHMTSHALSIRVMNHDHERTEEIKCEKCNKVFLSDKKLQRHLKMAHQKPQKTFQCLECDKTFNTLRVLQNHNSQKHSDARQYSCDVCRSSFKTDAGLYAHRKTHTGSYDYSCHICLKEFKFKVHLSRHLTMHSQEKNFFCRFCSKSFGVKDNLNKHLKTHYKLFEFKCHICEFVTSQRRYLSMHMKTIHLVKS